MTDYLLLRSPSANRVYTDESAGLAAAELAVTSPTASGIEPVTLAGVSYLGFSTTHPDLAVLAQQSSALALFERSGDLLRPVELPAANLFDDDLVTIPKYQGKTNEQFTRLLLNVTLAAVERPHDGPRQILDPLAGRGTTLTTAWLAGHDGFGVEADEKSFEAMAAFLTTWLRRKRLKHKAGITPVRREGKSIGRRFDAEVQAGKETLRLGVFTGDTRDSAALFGRKKFDAVITDAPYGVVHGSSSDVRGTFGKRDRSPAGLLKASIPVWAGQLKRGGALGISWNTYGLAREDLAAIMTGAGLRVCESGPWDGFAHRVDSAIKRDLMVGVAPH
ncbi:MAG: site-specific DNA-methyltransferase [Propionibacteriaceae bacterium]|nr:site-specific DNA-methyltransferase [Propionibacteriaceae bacterium]